MISYTIYDFNNHMLFHHVSPVPLNVGEYIIKDREDQERPYIVVSTTYLIKKILHINGLENNFIKVYVIETN